MGRGWWPSALTAGPLSCAALRRGAGPRWVPTLAPPNCSRVCWPLRLAWLLGCGAVGGALMGVGAHFLTDLVTGMLLGVTVGACCRRAAQG